MALRVNEYCVGCGWCIPECKNGAIKEGDEVAVVDPERCTECVGWYEEPRCVQVCWLSAYEPDPEHRETREELLAKWQRLHPNKVPQVT